MTHTSMNTAQRIGFNERISYSFGDLASSMFWKLFSIFLLFFYTDIFGISAAAVGTMFLITRVGAAVLDPVMGMIGDRTVTRWGKFRPYLLFGSIPFAVIGILTFSTPGFGAEGKLVYAYITYMLMMVIYTLVNVPYASLLGVITADTGERTTLASYRFIGAFSGGILVTATANSLVEFFSAGSDPATGYRLTVTVYALVAAVFFVLTFCGTKERINSVVVKSSSLQEDLWDLTQNRPWFLLSGAAMSVMIFNSLRDASILYYFKYYVGDQTTFLFGEVGQGVLASAFMSTLLGSGLLGVLLTKPVSTRLGRKNTFILAGMISALLNILFFFVPPQQIGLIFLINILIGIPAGIVLPLVWAMYAEAADYSEWKTGRRATGLIFATSSMSQKIGWMIGGTISGWFLAIFGFKANVVQTAESLLGIRLLVSVLAAAGAILSAGFMYFYPLTECRMREIEKELETVRTHPAP
jgi:glycoside/pentoside/hexuronide:cation symporter, GPH family